MARWRNSSRFCAILSTILFGSFSLFWAPYYLQAKKFTHAGSSTAPVEFWEISSHVQSTVGNSRDRVELHTTRKEANTSAENECDEECEWRRGQNYRRDAMRTQCETLGTTTSITEEWVEKHKNSLSHLMYSDKHQTMFCFIPNVACTNWKLAFLIMNGRVNLTASRSIRFDAIHDMMYPYDKHSLATSSLSMEETLYRLNNFQSFIMVRNPFKRSVTAFIQKFKRSTARERQLVRHKYANPIHRKYAADRNDHTLNQNSSNDQEITFQEFVKYLGDPTVKFANIHSYEDHWIPMNELCFPCAIKYDYIGKFDSYYTDTKFMLNQLGEPHLLDTVAAKYVNASDSSGSLIQFLEFLTDEDIDGLRWRYDTDFKIFGYGYNSEDPSS